MKQKGISQYWTQKSEDLYSRILSKCKNFAERHMVEDIRTVIKYDMRTREGRRALAQQKLQLALATDEDLQELAELRQAVLGDERPVDQILQYLKDLRAKVRRRGIARKELETDGTAQ